MMKVQDLYNQHGIQIAIIEFGAGKKKPTDEDYDAEDDEEDELEDEEEE